MSKGIRGKVAYNNGIVTKYFSEDDVIPEGFVRGMKPLSEEAKRLMIERRKKSSLEKYGTEFPQQSDRVKKKTEETCMRRYGCKAPSQNDEIKERAAKVNIERYGYYSSAMAPEVKDKAAKTCIERYGFKSTAMSPEVKAKAAKTCMERYGAISPSLNKDVQDKKVQTCLKNFGVEYPMMSDEVRDKSKKTNLERYGTECAIQSEIVKQRVRETNLERYGVEYTSQSEEFKEKFKQTSLERYGTENPSQAEVVKDKRAQTTEERFGNKVYFRTKDFRDKTNETCMENYGVPWPCMATACRSASTNDSGPNNEFSEMLDCEGIEYDREFRIERYSYDFKVGNKLIEIDPYPYHNTVWNPYGKTCSRNEKDYHQRKSHTAEAQGYQVIHVFDWDDKSKIIDLLKPRERLYARNLIVRGVDKPDVSVILGDYHIQGNCRGQEVCVGLFDVYGNIKSIMTFGKPRYNKNYQYELLRYCSTANIIGGAEKLFTHFLGEYQPQSIISYCDRSKFRGDVYSKLGFTLLTEGKPSCHWYNPKTEQHFTDNLVRQRGVDQLLGTSYGKGTSNEELLIKHNFVPIYDCGQDTYVWSSK